MVTHYVTRRPHDDTHRAPRAYRRFMQHAAGGVACVMVLAVMSGLWVNLQSVEGENSTLRSELFAAKLPPSTCKITGNWQSDTTKQLSVATANGQRDFLVHVPREFKDTTYYPLVMVYPGRGATAIAAENDFGLTSLPAITVFPFPTLSQDGDTAWESAPYSSSADDVGFTSAVLDKVEDQLCVDKTRVYAIGMSIGGGFVSLLSCKLPDQFAAYAIVDGALYEPSSDCKPSRPSPIISVHGDSDSIVPYGGSTERNLPSIYSWVAGRAALEKCTGQSTTYPSGSIEVTSWTHCRERSQVENVRILGGDHEWGDVPNSMIWQFLTQFSL